MKLPSDGRLLLSMGLLAGCLAALPYQVFLGTAIVNRYRHYDTAWQVDLESQLADGRVSGRDFTFNFGPTYQALHGLGLVLPRRDMASIVRWYDLPGTLLVLAGLWYLLRASGASFELRAGLFLAWLLVVAAPGEFKATQVKPMLPLVAVWGGAFAAAGGWFESPVCRRLWGGGSWLLAPALLTTYSFELGMLTLAALGLGTAAALVALGRSATASARAVRRGIASGWLWGGLGCFLFLAPALVAATWRRYLSESWELSQSYQTAWAYPGGPLELSLLALPLLGALIIGPGVWWALRRQVASGRSVDPRLVALLATLAYSAVMVRYGITRSDLFHVWAALAPGTFVAGVLLPAMGLAAWQPGVAQASPGHQHRPRASSQPVASLFWLPLIPAALVMIPYLLSQTFNDGWKLKAASLLRVDARPPRIVFGDPGLEAASQAARDLPGEELLVWPYGGQIGRLAGKRNPCYSILPTEAHNPSLVRGTLERLEPLAELPVLVYRQAISTDQVSVVTRTTALFGWLLEHYRLAAPPEPSYAVLKRTAGRRVWREERLSESASERFHPGENRGCSIELAGDRCRASELLRVRLRAAETSLWGCRKPGYTLVALRLEGGRTVVRPLPLPMDGLSHDYLVSAVDLDNPLFLTHFAPKRGWRSRERVESVQVGWQPMDPLSRKPVEIELQELVVLRPERPEWLETGLGQQNRSDVQRWCYADGERPRALPVD